MSLIRSPSDSSVASSVVMGRYTSTIVGINRGSGKLPGGTRTYADKTSDRHFSSEKPSPAGVASCGPAADRRILRLHSARESRRGDNTLACAQDRGQPAYRITGPPPAGAGGLNPGCRGGIGAADPGTRRRSAPPDRRARCRTAGAAGWGASALEHRAKLARVAVPGITSCQGLHCDRSGAQHLRHIPPGDGAVAGKGVVHTVRRSLRPAAGTPCGPYTGTPLDAVGAQEARVGQGGKGFAGGPFRACRGRLSLRAARRPHPGPDRGLGVVRVRGGDGSAARGAPTAAGRKPGLPLARTRPVPLDSAARARSRPCPPVHPAVPAVPGLRFAPARRARVCPCGRPGSGSNRFRGGRAADRTYGGQLRRPAHPGGGDPVLPAGRRPGQQLTPTTACRPSAGSNR